MKTWFFIVATTAVFGANLAFQEDVSRLIHSGWEGRFRDLGVSDVIANPLKEEISTLRGRNIDIEASDMVSFEPRNLGPHSNIFDLVPETSFKDRLDVLFVGDSTVSWGFDHQQFERASGLRAASLSFGLNVPDEKLAAMVSLLADCVMHETGIVVISYSFRVISRERAKRRQDRAVVRVADSVTDCESLRALVAEKATREPERGVIEVLTRRELYNDAVLHPLERELGEHIPLWSAGIGWQDFFPSEDDEAGEELPFVRWNPAFRVPIILQPEQWRYRRLDTRAAEKSWAAMRGRLEDRAPHRIDAIRQRLSLWSKKTIGLPVCHVLPITLKNEDFRYGMWREFTDAECLLDYGEIVGRELGIKSLEMQSDHHYANASGLVMAAALGRFLKRGGAALAALTAARYEPTDFEGKMLARPGGAERAATDREGVLSPGGFDSPVADGE